MTPSAGAAVSPRGEVLRRVVSWLVVAAVFLHATQFAFALPLPGTRSVNVSLVDLVLAVALVLRIAPRSAGDRRIPRGFPWAALIGVVWLGLSLIPALKGDGYPVTVNPLLGLVKVGQFAEYFIVAWLLFAEAFEEPLWRKRAMAALAAACACGLVLAAVQYLNKGVPVVAVRGSWFADRNTFGMFLALALPPLWGVGLFARERRLVAVAALGVLAALALILSGGPFLAICIGVVVVAALRSARVFWMSAAVIVLGCVLVLPRLPRHNGNVLLDSMLLYKTADPHGVFGGDMERAASRTRGKEAALAEKITRREPVLRADLVTEEELSWRWQQRWKEWQAALGMMARSPLFGVGAGSYQKNVNAYYDYCYPMPKYPMNLMEPDTLSGYMVWGASAGLPFLVLLFAMYLRAARGAAEGFASMPGGFDRGLAAGLLGALAALAVGAVFTDPLVRGTGVTAALVLALAEALRRGAARSSVSREGTASCGDTASPA